MIHISRCDITRSPSWHPIERRRRHHSVWYYALSENETCEIWYILISRRSAIMLPAQSLWSKAAAVATSQQLPVITGDQYCLRVQWEYQASTDTQFTQYRYHSNQNYFACFMFVTATRPAFAALSLW